MYMLYSGWVDTPQERMQWGRSPFLDELQERMDQAAALGQSDGRDSARR